MLRRVDVEKVLNHIKDRHSNMSYDLLAVRMFTLVVRVLLDIREELSFIRQILLVGKGAHRPPDGE